jgi:hypothetical protein
MVNWGVVAAALVGLVVYPLVAIALHELFASSEDRAAKDEGTVDPPSINDTYQSRTIPGGRSGRRED